MNKKRIYLVGSVFGSYRARALLEYLASSPVFSFYYADPRYLLSEKRTLINRALFKLARIMNRIINLWKLAIADSIYVLPMSNLFFGERLLARMLSKKIIAEYYISNYDTYVNDRKTVSPDSRKARNLKRQDQKLIDNSTVLIFLNKEEQNYYLSIAGREKTITEIHQIPLCTDTKRKAKLPFLHNDHSEMILCWWGTFIPLHGLEKIVSAALILKAKQIMFKLFLFGTSEELSKPYIEYINKNNLTDCVIIDNTKNFSDRSLEHFLADNCDIAFGNFGDSIKAKTVMVNKVVEAASMGIPLISQHTAALDEYFTHGENIFFSDSTPESIAASVIELSQNKTMLKTLAEQSLALYQNKFTRHAYLEKVIPILEGSQPGSR